ncbi:hypothetical protein COBT_001368 [Conglomerata obtusa]
MQFLNESHKNVACNTITNSLNLIKQTFPETMHHMNFKNLEVNNDHGPEKINKLLKFFLVIYESKNKKATRKQVYTVLITVLDNFNFLDISFSNVSAVINFLIKNLKKTSSKIIFDRIDIKKHGNEIICCKSSRKNKNKYFYLCLMWLISENSIKQLFELISKDYAKIRVVNIKDMNYVSGINYSENEDYKQHFIHEVFKITKKELINTKWVFLYTICNNYDRDIFFKDYKHCNNNTIENTLQLMIESGEKNLDYVETSSPTILSKIFECVENKDTYIKRYIERAPINSKALEFNIFEFYDNFQFLNKNCNYEKINKILKYSKEINTLDNIKIDTVLDGLLLDQKITRCKLLDYVHMDKISFEEIKNKLSYCLNVLPENYFTQYVKNTTNPEQEIFIKFPNLVNETFLTKNIKNLDLICILLSNLTNVNAQTLFEKIVDNYFVENDYIYVLDKAQIPTKMLPLFLFKTYKVKDALNLGTCDCEDVTNNFFYVDFIVYLLKTKKLCAIDFIYKVHYYIKEADVKNCILFTDEFYYLNSFFYTEFQDLPVKIEKATILSKCFQVLNNNDVISAMDINEKNFAKFTILVIQEVLCHKEELDYNFEITDTIKDSIKKSNPLFCFKILFDFYDNKEQSIDEISKIYVDYQNENKEFILEYFNIKSNKDEYLSSIYYGVYPNELIIDQKNFNTYATIYLLITKCSKFNYDYLRLYKKTKNTRIQNFLVKNINSLGDDLLYDFAYKSHNVKSIEKISILHKNGRKLFEINSLLDFDNEALQIILNLKTKPNQACKKIIMLCDKTVDINENTNFYDKRKATIKSFNKKLSMFIAIKMQNEYEVNNLTKTKLGLVLFDAILADFNFTFTDSDKESLYKIKLFLDSVEKIRNLVILKFLQHHLTNSQLQKFIMECNEELILQSFAYNFPRLSHKTEFKYEYITKELGFAFNKSKIDCNENENSYVVIYVNKYDEINYSIKLVLDKFEVKNNKLIWECKDLLIDTKQFESNLINSRKFLEVLRIFDRRIINQIKQIDKCSICYERLTQTSASNLVQCKQCKNLFHSICICKWYEVDHLEMCPVCRGIMQISL